jgi:hypothetical protein
VPLPPGWSGVEAVAISDPQLKQRLTGYFENLSDDVEKTSQQDPAYNCVAWAAQADTGRWWEDLPIAGYYWPEHLRGPDAGTVVGWVKLFRWLGFETCHSRDLEPGFERVAIYVLRDGTVTHVARQLEDGQWTSKLGRWIDIRHRLEDLCGQEYGQVGPVMRRTTGRPTAGPAGA